MRNRNYDASDTKNTRSFEPLINFLRQEVKEKAMVVLAQSGFPSCNTRNKDSPNKSITKETDEITTMWINKFGIIIKVLISLKIKVG